jgi:hypothetical protein
MHAAKVPLPRRRAVVTLLSFAVLLAMQTAALAVPPQFRPSPNTDNGYERTLLTMAYLRYLEQVLATVHGTPGCSDAASQPYVTGVSADNEDRTYGRCYRPACVPAPASRGRVPHPGSNR